MDVALHRLPVTFVLDRAGVTGPDGASHHGMWDGSILQIVPGHAGRGAARRRPAGRAAAARRSRSATARPCCGSPRATLGRRRARRSASSAAWTCSRRPADGHRSRTCCWSAPARWPRSALDAARPAGRPGHRRDRGRPALGQAGGRRRWPRRPRAAPAGGDRRGQRPGRRVRRRGVPGCCASRRATPRCGPSACRSSSWSTASATEILDDVGLTPQHLARRDHRGGGPARPRSWPTTRRDALTAM